jgi:hypothetical protein
MLEKEQAKPYLDIALASAVAPVSLISGMPTLEKEGDSFFDLT